MIAAVPPVRRKLTVCDGRNTIGFIYESWDKRFYAEGINGGSLGPFPTTAAAAEAISAERKRHLSENLEGAASNGSN